VSTPTPPALTVSQATAYKGTRHRDRSTAVRAYDLRTGWGEPLRHVVKHSPAGFEWGYEGSGPAELARCLLIDVLGPAAACPECAGTGRVMFTGPDADQVEPYDPDAGADGNQVEECYCDGGYRGLPYQDFKREVVARLGYAGWRLTRADISRWLAAHYLARYPALPAWLDGLTADIELPR
jgi:hypothetical protein